MTRPSTPVRLSASIPSGQYGYGAMLALILIVLGVAVAMAGWRFFDLNRLLQRPRIEVH
jgi:inositol-phosphate transport system permease protein